MRTEKNQDIREYAKIKNVKFWEIAEKLNKHDSQFSRMLRHELPEDKKEEIRKIIDEVAAEVFE